MINSFPKGCDYNAQNEGANPGVQIFGHRFFGDEQILDLLSEFLLIVASPKKVLTQFDSYLPSMDELKGWSGHPKPLLYFPKSHLNLKLFSFLSSSRLETRHPTHRQHGEELWNFLRDKIDLDTAEEKNEFLKTLSLLFLGFWGNGEQRTWCAQTFFPFCQSALCGEVIWNAALARRARLQLWGDVIAGFSTYFGQGKHVIFCRGGEALYLQICNTLSQSQDEIAGWIHDHVSEDYPLGLTELEQNPKQLHQALQTGFSDFFGLTPRPLDEVMAFVDTGVDSETAQKSDFDNDGQPRGVKCGWVPQESWREGYLFAVELHRVLSANVGIMEKVELLQMACALQVMRSLVAQSYRHSKTPSTVSDGFDYRVLISNSETRKRKIKNFSAQSHVEIAREIQQVIRIPEIFNEVSEQCHGDPVEIRNCYRRADNQYGFKLYRKIGKSIGLIVPPTGGRMRYTLNDKLLKYLIVSMMPQERMTLDTFKKQIELHHGFVFNLKGLLPSRNWKDRGNELSDMESSDAYLERMLDACGVLVRLSDSCSLVKNPYVAPQI